MLRYRYGATSTTGCGQMARYYMDSEKVPEMHGAMAAYYAGKQNGQDAGALAVPRASMHPLVADRLGIDLSRPLSADELANLLNAKRADGSEIEGRRPIKNGYIDFVYAAPKSYVVAAIHASPRERELLEAAFLKSVDFVMDLIAKEIGSASIGKTAGNMARNREPAEVAMIPIHHWTARPTVKVAIGEDTKSYEVQVPGDPFRHVHILTLNHAFVPSTGRVTSLYQAGLEQKIHEIGALGQAMLGTELRKLGVNWELDSTPGLSFNERMGRLTDIPREMCDLYSKRHEDGLGAARKYATDRGFDYDSLSPQGKADLLQPAVLKTRKPKAPGLGEYESWMQQARDAGYKHRSVLRPGQEQELRPGADRLKQAYDVAMPLIDEQLERRAVLEGSVPRVAAAKGLIAAGIASADEVNAITEAMRTEGVQQDGQTTLLRWAFDPAKRYARVTTQLSVEMEQEAIGLLQTAAADKSVSLTLDQIERAVAKVSARDKLDFTSEHGLKQREFINKIGTAGRAAVGVGVAGSGKSSALRPLVEAWHETGRTTWGVTLAWRQTQGLRDAGVGGDQKRGKRKFVPNKDTLTDAGIAIERTFALVPFLKRVHEGKIQLDANSTVIIDEVALVGTKQILEIAKLQAKHGFHVVGIGDDMQNQPISAGATIDLARRAFGAEAVPELLSSTRQLVERDRETAQMWREGKAAEALARKDEDGTLRIVPGGYTEAIKATVDLWSERTDANRSQPGFSLGISVPTNADGRAIGEAIRLRRRATGEVGPDLLQLAACDQNGESYALNIAKGDRVRLFDRVRGRDSTGRVSIAGVNGTVVDVLHADRDGMDVRKPSGKVARIGWDALRKEHGPIRLSYGDAVTIDARQSDTVTEHITSMPSGSAGVNGFKAYTTESRHRVAAWVVTSQGAEKEEIQQRRPLGDPRNRETDVAEIKRAVMENMARNMSEQTKKTLAVDFMERAVDMKSGTVNAGQARWHKTEDAGAAPSAAAPAPSFIEQRQEDQSIAQAIAVMTEDQAALLRVASAVRDIIVVPPPTVEETAIARRAALVAGGRLAYSEALSDLLTRYINNGGDIEKIDAVEERYGLALAGAAGAVEEGANKYAVTRAVRNVPMVTQEQRDAARAIAPDPIVNSTLLQQQDLQQDRSRNESFER
jgi:hypothetical protein